jgi:hypothetical protein
MSYRIPTRYERHCQTGDSRGEGYYPKSNHALKFDPCHPLEEQQAQYARDVAAGGLADEGAADGQA